MDEQYKNLIQSQIGDDEDTVKVAADLATSETETLTPDLVPDPIDDLNL